MNSRSRSLATHAAELAFAAPQVVAHRVAQMAAAGHAPSARDRREFHLMSEEKMAAFGESWFAMGAEVLRLQQAWATTMWHWCLAPWAGAMPWPPTQTQWQDALHGVLGRGLEPVHRRAMANAKRLGRITRR
jgi:hypothetical protein